MQIPRKTAGERYSIRCRREGRCLRALRLMPRTVIRVALPTGSPSSVLHGELAPIAGSRSPLRIRVLSGESALFEHTVAADADPIPLAVNLPATGEVTIEVDFVDALAFPCALDLRDARIVAAGTQPAEQD